MGEARRPKVSVQETAVHGDVVAFDPATVGATALERVYDLPGGADRLIARSTGVTHTWVNGVTSRADGQDVPDAAAGQPLKG